jgi:hypothetical protein
MGRISAGLDAPGDFGSRITSLVFQPAGILPSSRTCENKRASSVTILGGASAWAPTAPAL